MNTDLTQSIASHFTKWLDEDFSETKYVRRWTFPRGFEVNMERRAQWLLLPGAGAQEAAADANGGNESTKPRKQPPERDEPMSGQDKNDLGDARRAYERNMEFRRFFHSEYGSSQKLDGNPDLPDQSLLDAWRDWRDMHGGG